MNDKEIRDRLKCTSEELEYCKSKVGKSLVSIEAFWSINKDIIKKIITETKAKRGSKD